MVLELLLKLEFLLRKRDMMLSEWLKENHIVFEKLAESGYGDFKGLVEGLKEAFKGILGSGYVWPSCGGFGGVAFGRG